MKNVTYKIFQFIKRRIEIFSEDPFVLRDLDFHKGAIEPLSIDTIIKVTAALCMVFGIYAVLFYPVESLSKPAVFLVTTVGGALLSIVGAVLCFTFVKVLGSGITFKHYLEVAINEYPAYVVTQVMAFLSGVLGRLSHIPLFDFAAVVFLMLSFYRILRICEAGKARVQFVTFLLTLDLFAGVFTQLALQYATSNDPLTHII